MSTRLVTPKHRLFGTLLLTAILAMAPAALQLNGVSGGFNLTYAHAVAKDDGGGGSNSGSGSGSGDGSGNSGSGSGNGGSSSSGSGSDNGGDNSGRDGEDDDHSDEGGNTMAATRLNGQSMKVEIRGARIIIRYADGFREEITGGVMTLMDPKGRTVVRRPVNARDKARLRALGR